MIQLNEEHFWAILLIALAGGAALGAAIHRLYYQQKIASWARQRQVFWMSLAKGSGHAKPGTERAIIYAKGAANGLNALLARIGACTAEL